MKYINDSTNPADIIKDYSRHNYSYMVKYMDGFECNYCCSKEGHEEEIINKMLEQAKEREKLENVKLLKFKKNLSLFASIVSTLCTISLYQQGKISALTIILLIASLYQYFKMKNRIEEIEKYKLFFELIPDLDTINHAEFLKCVECDNWYQIPFTINHLDEYSYNDVCTIYNKVKTKK